MWERIDALIKERGLNISRLARETGINRFSVQQWKRGDFKPSLDALTVLADYFGVTLDWLAGRIDQR